MTCSRGFRQKGLLLLKPLSLASDRGWTVAIVTRLRVVFRLGTMIGILEGTQTGSRSCSGVFLCLLLERLLGLLTIEQKRLGHVEELLLYEFDKVRFALLSLSCHGFCLFINLFLNSFCSSLTLPSCVL